MKKCIQFERNKHVIQNSLILFFCLILFVGSFFIGVVFEYEHYMFNDYNTPNYKSGLPAPLFPIRLNTIRFIEGALACVDSKVKAEKYLNENKVMDDFYLTVADCLLTAEEKEGLMNYELVNLAAMKLPYVQSDDEVCAAIGDKLSQSDINYLKVYVYNSMQVRMPYSVDIITGYFMGFLILAMELCIMISSLVFSIMALVALIKRQQLKKPLLSLLLPLIFVLILVIAFGFNATYTITGVFVAMIVLSILSVILLAVHKWLFEDVDEKINVQAMAKKLTLTAIGLVACFVTLGVLFTYRLTDNGQDATFKWNIRSHNLIRYMIESAQYENYANELVFVIMVYLFYIGALTSLITVVLSVCTRLHNDKPNALLVRSIMSIVMSVIAILFIFVIRGRYVDGQFGNGVNVEIKLGVSLFISVAMCVALIVVDAAWKIPAKAVVTSEPQEVIAQTNQ